MRRLVTCFLAIALLAVVGPSAAAEPPPTTEAPTMSIRTDILPGAALTVEEVEPGVFRVVDDGVRDVASVGKRDLVAGYDGGIWLLWEDEFLRLGDDGSYVWPMGSGLEDHVFEVAPDGKMWITPCGSGWYYPRQCGDARRSTDGEEWTVQPCPEGSQDCQGFTVAPDGTVWATWRVSGSTSRGQWEVGRLGPAGWQPLDADARYDSTPFRGYRRMWVTDAGDVYGMGYDYIYRYEDGGWVNVAPRGWHTLADVGPDGTIWLGNNDGLGRFADGEWKGWRSADILGTGHGFGYEATGDDDYDFLGEMRFQVAPDRSLWLSQWRMWDRTDPLMCGGLARFDGQRLDRLLPGRCISSMDIAADGSVWVITDEDTDWVFDHDDVHWVLDDGDQGRDLYVITPEAVPTSEAIDTTVPTTISSDILPGATLTVEEVEPGVYHVLNDGVRDVEQVTMTVIGDDGSVWMDSAKGIFALGRPSEYPGLVGGEGLLTFAEDGTLWAASGDSPDDLRSFDGEAWTRRGTIPDEIASVPDPWWPADYITDFAVHPDGTVWQVAEQNGHDAHTRVQHLGAGTWTTYDVRDEMAALGWCGICGDGEPCPAVDCEGGWGTLEITPDGTVWVGVPPRHPPVTMPSGGLLRFDGTDWAVVRPLGGAEDHGVVDLLADRDGALWAEFETGELARFDGTDWAVVRPLDGDEDHRVGLLADRDGVLWVRTETGHLARFDGQAWQIFSGDRDPDGTHAVDPDGNLWVGRESDRDDGIASGGCDGVRRFDGPTWTTFLPGMCIADIDIAGDGSVWVRTDDDDLAWIPGYGYGGDLYAITREAVAATE